jgi:hypothetical protein
MREELLSRLNRDWQAFLDSFDGLPDDVLSLPCVVGDWSVRDIMGHITTWEEEALKSLPLILARGTPKSYGEYGGVDAFNAQESAEKRSLSLDKTRQMLTVTHQTLLDRIVEIPDKAADAEFERRLGEDTWEHYEEHAAQIRAWRIRL